MKSRIIWYSFLFLCGNVFFSSRYIGDQLGHDATDIGRRHLHCIGPTTRGKDEKKNLNGREKTQKNFLKYDLYVGRFLAPSVAADLANCQFFPPDPEALASPSSHCRDSKYPNMTPRRQLLFPLQRLQISKYDPEAPASPPIAKTPNIQI